MDRVGVVERLPVELWELISTFQSLRSLSRAVMVSKGLCSALLPCLKARKRELVASRIQRWWRIYRRCRHMDLFKNRILSRGIDEFDFVDYHPLIYLIISEELGLEYAIKRDDRCLDLIPEMPFSLKKCFDYDQNIYTLSRCSDVVIGFRIRATGVHSIDFKAGGNVLARWRGNWPTTSRRLLFNMPVFFIDFPFHQMQLSFNQSAKIDTVDYIDTVIGLARRAALITPGYPEAPWMKLYSGKLRFD
jgi:hypothetical protein